jgi:hypothetical protein
MKQRRAFGDARGHHPAYKNVVIAHWDALFHLAFDGRQDAVDQWYPGFPGGPGDAPKTVLTLARETLRNGPLVFG